MLLKDTRKQGTILKVTTQGRENSSQCIHSYFSVLTDQIEIAENTLAIT